MLGSYGPDDDKIFDRMTIVDLSADLGIGSDCGRLNVGSTLRAGLSNILNDQYFRSMGRNIVAASPMLLTCYLSPTWCSILKHSRLRASSLMQTRMSQCGMIDRYTDSRTEEFAKARQTCVREEIGRSGGDFEAAMNTCQNIWNRDLSDWAGDNRPKRPENRVIDSSAQWAGASNPESTRVKRLLTAMVGDTVVRRGHVSVDYGPQQKPLTPRTYLTKLEAENQQKLCNGIVARIERAGGGRADINSMVSDADLQSLSADSSAPLIDRQTIQALFSLPPMQRRRACIKLADSISMATFSSDMSKTLDFMTATVTHNPHLPDNRRLEAEAKRRALKDQIELTLALNKHKNEPLNEVLFQINESSDKYRSRGTGNAFSSDESFNRKRKTENQFLDCADGLLCN